MRKSVMKSMIIGCLSVMLASFLIMTPVFFFSIRNEAINETYDEMESAIDHVEPVAKILLSVNFPENNGIFSPNVLHLEQFEATMGVISYFTKSQIIITDDDGNVLWTDTPISGDAFFEACEQISVESIGHNPLKSRGLMDAVYGQKTLTVCERLSSESGDGSWIIMSTRKLPDYGSKYTDVIIELLIMELSAILFMAAFMYVFSRNITVPLNKINKSVKAFTKGDFDSRVEYKSNNELGELAENINNMAVSIQNLEKMRSDFVSDVSHELRTPMTSISGFVQGMLDGTIPPEAQDKYLGIVLSESRRLSRLVNDLLSISRLDSGKQKITKKAFDIVELSANVLIKFEKEITEKNIHVDFEMYDDSVTVNADADAITQVLINLIHNAVKFTESEGNIIIRLKEDKKKCVFSVENTGRGIEPDKLKFIWERFYKTDNSRSTDRTGVGLGLYIVKRIIDAHNEKIYVESIPSEYTRFTFTLELI